MLLRAACSWFSIAALILSPWLTRRGNACCPAPRRGMAVVNADQTVIMIWDKDTQTQHFIRKASFRSDADDFGFIVPSPSEPELSESGDEAFGRLLKWTEPEVQRRARPAGGVGCGCGSSTRSGADKTEAAAKSGSVKILQKKEVAGFNATVLEAGSSDALVKWLKDNGYAYSDEVKAWAQPYVDKKWKFTALKVAKAKDGQDQKTVAAKSLRLSFKTKRPLFPYREPATSRFARSLHASKRLLRIYFIADARYKGGYENAKSSWGGRVAWASRLSDQQRSELLEKLGLPKDTGPAEFYLTEFEDNWPYAEAPSDVFFSRDGNQASVKRPPIIIYTSSMQLPTDVTLYGMVGVFIVLPMLLRLRRRRD